MVLPEPGPVVPAYQSNGPLPGIVNDRTLVRPRDRHGAAREMQGRGHGFPSPVLRGWQKGVRMITMSRGASLAVSADRAAPEHVLLIVVTNVTALTGTAE